MKINNATAACVLCFASLFLTGCGTETCDAPEDAYNNARNDTTAVLTAPLVEAAAWTLSGAEHDPLTSHRPVAVVCPSIGWGAEEGSLEVNTGECNYLSVEQPLLGDVPEGVKITIDMWHQVLYAETEATAHAALVVGDDVLWEREALIPGPPDIWRDVVVAPRDLHAGERVIFHLHNHGANTWNLGSVTMDEGEQ